LEGKRECPEISIQRRPSEGGENRQHRLGGSVVARPIKQKTYTFFRGEGGKEPREGVEGDGLTHQGKGWTPEAAKKRKAGGRSLKA